MTVNLEFKNEAERDETVKTLKHSLAVMQNVTIAPDKEKMLDSLESLIAQIQK
jgi:hypothetical protein